MIEISYEDLNKRFELHSKWLNHEHGGKRLVLNNTDLSNMKLTGRDFRMAVAIQSDFKGADISNCNFRESNISGSDLSYCNITGSDFTGAVMDGVKKVGINIGNGYNSEIRTIRDIVEYGELEDSKIENREEKEIDESDIKAADGVAIDRMIDNIEFEEEQEDEWFE